MKHIDTLRYLLLHMLKTLDIFIHFYKKYFFANIRQYQFNYIHSACSCPAFFKNSFLNDCHVRLHESIDIIVSTINSHPMCLASHQPPL
jgi:hypothetical protein